VQLPSLGSSDLRFLLDGLCFVFYFAGLLDIPCWRVVCFARFSAICSVFVFHVQRLRSLDFGLGVVRFQ